MKTKMLLVKGITFSLIVIPCLSFLFLSIPDVEPEDTTQIFDVDLEAPLSEIKLQDIIYIKSVPGGSSYVYSKNNKVKHIDKSIKKLKQELHEYVVPVNQSELVNPSYFCVFKDKNDSGSIIFYAYLSIDYNIPSLDDPIKITRENKGLIEHLLSKDDLKYCN